MPLIENFIEKQIRWGRVEMFYLWGHSYEFDNDNNWKVIEEFAKYAGNHSDIWYATNIEIYKYVKAYGQGRSNNLFVIGYGLKKWDFAFISVTNFDVTKI